MQDNVNLGPEGKLVRVKPGYARNHLVPSRQAALATPANRAAFERKDAVGGPASPSSGPAPGLMVVQDAVAASPDVWLVRGL